MTLSINLSAQENLKIGAELRNKTILDNGYKMPNNELYVYTSQRSRLYTNFKTENTETYISFQDVRIWGDDNTYKKNGTFGNTESVSLHQAWTDISISYRCKLKIGRQLFVYDDERILSARNWNDYQVTYDAVLFKIQDSLSRFDCAVSWNNAKAGTNEYPSDKYRTIDFVRIERQIGSVNISLIDIVCGKTLTDTTTNLYFKNTIGANGIYKKQNNSLRASVYYQHHINKNGEKLSAYCISVSGNRRFYKNKVSLGAGFDYVSGNSTADTAEQSINHRFDLLYGKRHGYYGYMDYFNSIPEQGLQDHIFKFEYSPVPQLSFSLDYHYFRLARDYFQYNKDLGHEIDLGYRKKLSKWFTLKGGYSCFFTNSTIKNVTNSESKGFEQMGYILLNIKPEFEVKSK